MIVENYGTEFADVWNLERSYCPTCQQEQPFQLLLQYHYVGIYWIFCFVIRRRYYRRCAVCHFGHKVPAREVPPTFEPAPIPYMRRFGLLTLIVGATLFFGFLKLLDTLFGA